MQYLTFKLNEVSYAVDVRIVETVVQYGGVTVVPTPLPYMRGVMDLRGSVIPLIDLRKKLGLPVREDLEGTSVIVFSVKGDQAGGVEKRLTVGAIVDGVSEVLTIDEKSVEIAKGEGVKLWERYVDGVARYEGGMVVIIRPEGLFSLEEIATLLAA
jgi:purine-binding chemotaxis protein CheW